MGAVQDCGDHPPITPVRLGQLPDKHKCGGEAGWALYELIVRHFLGERQDEALHVASTLITCGRYRDAGCHIQG